MFATSDMIRQWNENGKAYFPTFATNAELDAAVAANGGQSLGPSVSVAGVLWDWSATRGRYIPGNAVSFATYAALPTLANTSQDIGVKCWLVNSLTPEGMTRMYWTGALWAPVAGQRLYYAKGTLLDMTAAALSIGAWNEVWQSPVLPAWMILLGDPNISLSAEVELADPVSTAVSKLRMNLLPAASSAGGEGAGIFGVAGATDPYGKGFTGGRSRASVVGGNLWATWGASPFTTSTQPHRPIGAGLDGSSTRLRLDAWPGATTNTIKLFSVALWSGE